MLHGTIGWFNAIEVVQEWRDESIKKDSKHVINISLPEAWRAREALKGSLIHILHHQVGDNHRHWRPHCGSMHLHTYTRMLAYYNTGATDKKL